MATRNLNKVMLIGNLTRDPEVRYTPQGSAVASFVVATNREWKVDGELKQVADFHNVVAWNKLAEICGQLLTKGIKVYVEGRLQTRNWDDAQGTRRYKTETVIEDLIILSPKRDSAPSRQEQEEKPTDDVDLDDSTFDDINLDDLDLDGDVSESEESAKEDKEEVAEAEKEEDEEDKDKKEDK